MLTQMCSILNMSRTKALCFFKFCGIQRVKGESAGDDEEERDQLSREGSITLKKVSEVEGDDCTGTDASSSRNIFGQHMACMRSSFENMSVVAKM